VLTRQPLPPPSLPEEPTRPNHEIRSRTVTRSRRGW